MSKNSNCEPDGDDDNNNNNDNNNNDNNDEDNEDDGDNKRLLKGCCLKRLTRHVMRVHLGGHGIGHSKQSEDIWIRKENTPTMSMVAHHLVHF